MASDCFKEYYFEIMDLKNLLDVLQSIVAITVFEAQNAPSLTIQSHFKLSPKFFGRGLSCLEWLPCLLSQQVVPEFLFCSPDLKSVISQRSPDSFERK